MSFYTWHTYGYGICVSDIVCESVEKLSELFHRAPGLEKAVNDWLKDCNIENPTWDDYMEYDEDFNLGLATFLKEVILECEGIELTACDDFDGNQYLIYEPSYPWHLPEEQISLTEERIKEIILKYVPILTEQQIEVGYHSPENGG